MTEHKRIGKTTNGALLQFKICPNEIMKKGKKTSKKLRENRPKGKKTRRSSFRRRAEKSSTIKALEKKINNLREWRRRLSALLKYTKHASTTTTLDELLYLMAEEAKIVLGAERATVFLVDKEKKELWSKAALDAETIRIPLHKGIAGAVATSGQVLNIPDVYKDHRFNPEIDQKTGYRTRSALTSPMRNAKNQVIGVFQVLNRLKGGSFDQQDEEILALLSDQASAHVENAHLYQELRKSANETVIRLAGAVEFKDYDTRQHLWRMSQYSALIALEMGFEAEWAENLRLAAPMHDIGKIGVPDSILKKPGKLTAEEWVEMKKHPQYGADILGGSDNEIMQMSASVALHHHERWDGNGYPNGIKADEIPIEARIASLADVFDALTSKRIYKPSFSVDETLQMIRDESGKQFDPQVVEAFFKCLDKITPIMEAYAPRGDSEKAIATPSF